MLVFVKYFVHTYIICPTCLSVTPKHNNIYKKKCLIYPINISISPLLAHWSILITKIEHYTMKISDRNLTIKYMSSYGLTDSHLYVPILLYENILDSCFLLTESENNFVFPFFCESFFFFFFFFLLLLFIIFIVVWLSAVACLPPPIPFSPRPLHPAPLFFSSLLHLIFDYDLLNSQFNFYSKLIIALS